MRNNYIVHKVESFINLESFISAAESRQNRIISNSIKLLPLEVIITLFCQQRTKNLLNLMQLFFGKKIIKKNNTRN